MTDPMLHLPQQQQQQHPQGGTEAVNTSLLSLSIAAASVAPIPVMDSFVQSPALSVFSGAPMGPGSPSNVHSGTAKLHASTKHRRLSSTGLVKRRLSDAREAAARPSAVTIQTAAAALSSLATLSLSTSPAQPTIQTSSTSPTVATISAQPASDVALSLPAEGQDLALRNEDAENQDNSTIELSAGGITIKNGKKRGMIFKCESCSKVYRHPSCLIKHRWEHSPHWREASKFLLSKHQQVQLLEAAAILSHLSPSATGGTSLPEDRSLWPSFLSGGTLPPPSSANAIPINKRSSGSSSLDTPHAFPTSSSLPSLSVAMLPARPLSTGPRLHDYSIPTSGGVTHVRPGVLGVPTVPELVALHEGVPRAVPVPVPISIGNGIYRDNNNNMAHSYASASSDPWGSPASLTYGQSSYHSSSFSGAQSYGTGGGGWSIPRSSVRSVSVTSGSRSRSGSVPKSEDDDGDAYVVDVDVDGIHDLPGELHQQQQYGFASRGRTSATRHGWEVEGYDGVVLKPREPRINEVWDGMEMEMEM